MITLNRHSKSLTAPVVYNAENWEGLGQNLDLTEFYLLDKVDLVRKKFQILQKIFHIPILYINNKANIKVF